MDQRDENRTEQPAAPAGDLLGVTRDVYGAFSRDLYIEVFGVLIPGFFFVFLSFFTVVVPAHYLLTSLEDLAYLPDIGFFFFEHAIIGLIISLFAAYVSGHIFFRGDPKNPDFESIKRLPPSVREAGCVRSVDFNYTPHQRERYNGSDEYPYGHLPSYLNDRGFEDLRKYVPWSSEDFAVNAGPTSQRSKRTKHLINRIKLRLKRYNRLLYFEIIRNEAHIRLMSSLWYMSGYMMTLVGVVFIGSVLAAITTLFILHVPFVEWPAGKYEALGFPIACGLAALWLRHSIEGFFHYQRVREIVFVLEAFDQEGGWRPSSPPIAPLRRPHWRQPKRKP